MRMSFPASAPIYSEGGGTNKNLNGTIGGTNTGSGGTINLTELSERQKKYSFNKN